jgi:hypothetical protein
MKTFREFLESRQMMMFSTRPRELYHGTTAGEGESTLASFRSRGVVSGASAGYGQGGGFFVYSDRSSARKHAVGIATGRGSSYRSGRDNGGRPMVITVEAVMEPDDWDIDYELNYRAVMEYLLKNFDSVKDKMQSDDISVEKVSMGQKPWERDGFKGLRPAEVHPLASGASKDDDLTLEPMESATTGFALKARGPNPIRTHIGPTRGRTIWHHGDRQEKGGLTTDGETVAIIMGLLQKNDPRAVRSFEELFFANMGAGVAVKYVGKSPMKIKSIETASVDGNMMPNQAVDDSYWTTA